MALKFVRRAPLTSPKKVVKKAAKPVIRRKSAILAVEKPRNIVQDYAIDQFGELAGRKRDAAKRARDLGHDLLPWHERPNDPAGRWNGFCVSCNRAVVVCTEAPSGFPDIYGPAIKDECPVVLVPEPSGSV